MGATIGAPLFYSIFTLVSQSIYSKSAADVLNSSLDIDPLSTADPYPRRIIRYERLLMPIHENDLKALAGLLVKEFRACQALLNLTQEERQALAQGDVLRLLALAEHKDALLDRLNTLASARQLQIAKLSALKPNEDRTVIDHLKTLDPDAELQLATLFEGIQVLKSQVRELALGNRALAATALNQAAALQAGLVSSTQKSLPALFAAILAARDALDAQDSAAISAALGELQNALNTGDYASANGPARSAPVTSEAVQARPESSSIKTGANMIEYMANLYRQEKAYRAVLKVSSRMLASA
jgi:flagellar biosynthesis/type III secretory pathway chaperone